MMSGLLRQPPAAWADRIEPAAIPRSRWPRIDALRGFAVLAMIAYHATWNAAFFGYLPSDLMFGVAGTWSARLIAGAFLVLSGVSLVLAHEAGFEPRRFWRRLAILAAAAALVSLVSILAMPGLPIYFGILHAMALFSLLALPFRRAPLVVVAGAAAIVFGLAFFTPGLGLDRGWLWLAPPADLPVMADYAPTIPWFAVLLTGIVLVRLPVVRALLQGQSLAPAVLARLGRWSLPIYLTHQPILFGLFLALRALSGR
jgi:uncharacterized membrane protein